MNLKKPTTYAEQIELLKKKNIIVQDYDSCIKFLTTVNYYRLSGYYLPFKRSGEKQCFITVPFERIQNIYYFDAELRNLLSGVIEKIEVFLKTQFSYYHAHKYGAEGYMLASSFNRFHKHQAFLNHIQNCIKENKNTLVVKHHQAHYNGHFPIWVIIEYFSIGMLSYFYLGMKNPDKSHLAQELFDTNYQTLDSWLRCLTDLRNRCAHYSRIYYWIFPALPKMPNSETYKPTRRLFAQIYMLKKMYPEPQKWNQVVLKPLIKLVKKYRPYISLNHIDFPYHWKSMLKIK